jgi:CubicO group peptidase (beta-lactamase class C family)
MRERLPKRIHADAMQLEQVGLVRLIGLACMLLAVVTLQATTPEQGATVWLADPSHAMRIARAESEIAPVVLATDDTVALTLQGWMDLYKIPGLSVAVFDDSRLIWAKVYGFKEAGNSDPVTLDTLFQAGSISKPVTAMAVLHFVEAGKWTLDEDINGKLVSWKVPPSEFLKDERVTLRRLLSHNAGTTVHGFPGYEVGAPVPTIVQVLNGEAPANTAPVRVDLLPGSKVRYSGGGTTIVQLMMVDQLKKPFPQIMAETVLAPLGMAHSSYEQPLPPDRAILTATGTRSNGKAVKGRWHIYPEMAAAGLWTTASDLARVAIEVSRAYQGRSSRVLSQPMTRQMLTTQAGDFGLGFAVDAGKGSFGHNGADEGFQAYLFAFAETGRGVAIMANSHNGSILFRRLAESIGRAHGWKGLEAR